MAHFVEMWEGVKKVRKQADVLVFDGPSRDHKDALLVVEVKRSDAPLKADAAGQARGYAIWTTAPYYLVTNGRESEVWLFRSAVEPDVRLMRFEQSQLRDVWPELQATLGRAAVVAFKHERLKQTR